VSAVNFVVYDSTGGIRWFGSCDSADLASQAPAGLAVLQTSGSKPDNQFKVDVTQSPPAVVARTS